MKITHKTLTVEFTHEVTVGNNDAIQATLVHNAYISERADGKISVDVDYIDIMDIKFLGMPIEGGYQGYKDFKARMKDLGIDVEKLLDAAEKELITDALIQDLKKIHTL
jgi:hypothetical protein